MSSEGEYSLIGRNITRKKIRRKGLFRFIIKICFNLLIIYITYFITKNYLIKEKECNEDVTNRTYIHIPKDSKLFNLNDFYPVNGNNTKGPITVNRMLDNGNKVNLYEKILNITENDLETFYYDQETFDSLDESLVMEDEYFCESNGYKKEYEIKCPKYYHIAIDKAYYGRYVRDLTHCTENDNGETIPKYNLIHIKNMVTNCGKEYTSYYEESCNGYENCRIVPSLSTFRNSCKELFKYVHVKYHCVKDKEIKKPKFAVVMFSNFIEPNSIFENAISEFYQYADIHNYEFFFNKKKYDNDRSTYYMKINSLIEAIIYGLKTGEFNWIFWVDSDVVLTNPNIKLEVFVPDDNDIHLLFSEDHNGLNAGILILRVHSWTLNFLMRVKSFQYFNKGDDLFFVDQTAINNVLVADREERHYMIVPNKWFNIWYYNYKRSPGDFLFHFAGRGYKKTKDSAILRKEVYKSPKLYGGVTNKELRKKVLEYYEENKDVNKRKKLSVQP